MVGEVWDQIEAWAFNLEFCTSFKARPATTIAVKKCQDGMPSVKTKVAQVALWRNSDSGSGRAGPLRTLMPFSFFASFVNSRARSMRSTNVSQKELWV